MSELQSNEEVDLQTQLNIALELMTKDQANTWELQMQLIQKECEVMGARKRISDLEVRINELTGVYDEASTKTQNKR